MDGEHSTSSRLNRVLWIGDNLAVMRHLGAATVDLIYLDPPFNSRRTYRATRGSSAANASFTDTWDSLKVRQEQTWLADHGSPAVRQAVHSAGLAADQPTQAYLTFMAPRLVEAHRLLRATGSLYLHCDPTASHYLKVLLDCVFGSANFRNEIVWRIGWVSGFKTQKRGWIRNHDILLYYTKTAAAVRLFNKTYLPYPDGYRRRDGQPPTGQGVPLEDTWNCSDGDRMHSIQVQSFSREKTGWPTQKPLALLERVITASSNPGELVLDPFCGSGTTLAAAERLGRRWVGVDLDSTAAPVSQRRLSEEAHLDAQHVHVRPARPPVKVSHRQPTL